jgi:hypothetical protein
MVAKSWETSKITGLQLQLYLLMGRGSAEVVENVGRSNTGDSKISHEAVLLPGSIS